MVDIVAETPGLLCCEDQGIRYRVGSTHDAREVVRVINGGMLGMKLKKRAMDLVGDPE